MEVKENVSLRPYNTFGIEANARYFSVFSNVEELQVILNKTKKEQTNLLILGGGSNVLFTGNFDGLVLKNEIRGVELTGEYADYYLVKSGAGENWNEFVGYCISKGYCGLENLSLIPGNVGASPMQNIGAYGVEIKDVFHELEALHIETGEIHRFDNASCEFGYRESVFKRKFKGQYIILSVTFKLSKVPNFKTSYGAINQELQAMGIEQLSIQAVSKAVCNIRNSKLPNPAVLGNAGSFFKNPVIEKQQGDILKQQYADMPIYEQADGKLKLAAGWLIEQCGLKGKRIGDAGVHQNQALVLVNYSNASGSEILNLSVQIIEQVNQKFGVVLEREVNII